MDELARPARRSRRPVPLLDQRHREPARRGVERGPCARDPAADHEHVEGLTRPCGAGRSSAPPGPGPRLPGSGPAGHPLPRQPGRTRWRRGEDTLSSSLTSDRLCSRRPPDRHYADRTMGDVWVNVVLILVFILIGGFFAASELALVSLRESQVRALALQGRRGRQSSVSTANPNTFLAALQVGVTLAGFLSAALGAATLADSLRAGARLLGSAGVARRTDGARPITIVISFFSLVLGELAPKRLALQRAEGIALAVAPVVDLTGARPADRSSGCCRGPPTSSSGCSVATPASSARHHLRRGAAQHRHRQRVRSGPRNGASWRTCSTSATGSCARSCCRGPRWTSSTPRCTSTRRCASAGTSRTPAIRSCAARPTTSSASSTSGTSSTPTVAAALDPGRRPRPRRPAVPGDQACAPRPVRDALRRATTWRSWSTSTAARPAS